MHDADRSSLMPSAWAAFIATSCRKSSFRVWRQLNVVKIFSNFERCEHHATIKLSRTLEKHISCQVAKFCLNYEEKMKSHQEIVSLLYVSKVECIYTRTRKSLSSVYRTKTLCISLNQNMWCHGIERKLYFEFLRLDSTFSRINLLSGLKNTREHAININDGDSWFSQSKPMVSLLKTYVAKLSRLLKHFREK